MKHYPPQPIWLNRLYQANENAPDIVSIESIATMSRFTADTLQTQYGDVLAIPPLSDVKTPRMMGKALLKLNPPLVVSDGIEKFLRDNTHQRFWDNTHHKVCIEFVALG